MKTPKKSASTGKRHIKDSPNGFPCTCGKPVDDPIHISNPTAAPEAPQKVYTGLSTQTKNGCVNTGKPILDALLNASESFAEPTAADAEAPQKPWLKEDGITRKDWCASLDYGEAPPSLQRHPLPTPWQIYDDEGQFVIKCPWSERNKAGKAEGYGDYRGITVCTLEHQGENASVVTKRQAEANATLIVRSVNNHERFLDAVRAYVRARNDGGVSMADLSTIADTKLRVALAEYEGSAQ